MKRRLLCLVLILVMLPATLLFSGCTKKYDISTLEQGYKNIYSSNKIIKLEENNIKFDYSNYAYFNEQVNAFTNPFQYVKNYNAMLTNMMAFATKYLPTISQGNYEISKEMGKKIENQLAELETSLKDLDVAMQDTAYYADIIRNPSNQHCLIKLDNLYNTYNKAFEDAFNFNATLIDIYFDGVQLQDYTKATDFTALRAIVEVKFDARLIQQIVYTTQGFVEINIDSQNFSKAISIDGSTSFGARDSAYSAYAQTIKSLNKTFTSENVNAVDGDLTKKANFKELAVKLNNIQQVMNNEISYYVSACNSIKYAEKLNNINATKEDSSNLTLITNFDMLNGYYNTTLLDMLAELGV